MPTVDSPSGFCDLVHVVDSDYNVHESLRTWLSATRLEVRSHPSLASLMTAPFGEGTACLVIDASEFMARYEHRSQPESKVLEVPTIVIADHPCVATAVRAMKTGAVDFVEKPLLEDQIVPAVLFAVEAARKLRAVASRQIKIQVQFAKLTPRERQVMALVTAGRLNKQVGAALGLSEITVKAHRGSMMRKMGARSLAELVRMADSIGDELTWLTSEGSHPTRIGAVSHPRSGYTRHPG